MKWRSPLIRVKKTEWKKEDLPSNADLGEFPWWSIYITADQVVEVAVDDVFVKSESLPYPVEARGKLASRWGEIKLKVSNPINR